MIKVTILVPVNNHIEQTRTSIKNLKSLIYNTHYLSYHIIVIDDGSTDGTAEWLRDNYDDLTILAGDGNLWWSGAVNMGARFALEELNTDFILLWNNDIETGKGYFETLTSLLEKADDDTIYGSKIMVKENPGTVWSMGGRFDPFSGKYFMIGYYNKDSDKYNHPAEADWLTGMGTVIPRKAIEKAGYWDADNFPQYHGDSDFTYRAKKRGFKIIVHPRLIIYNSVRNSGLGSPDSLKNLFRLAVDIRSKSNIKKLIKFYRKHDVSPKAYFRIMDLYFKILGGYIKWKILGIFGIKKKEL